jgi:predicted ATPase/class 3 adenylate cyclase
MHCPGCNSDNPPENRFCEECGTRLEARCSECGAVLRPTARFCGACGAEVAGAAQAPTAAPAEQRDRAQTARADDRSYTPRHLVEKILNARSALQGERRQVTVLFADLAGFTTLAANRNPEEVHSIMDRCFEAMTAEVHRFEGTVNQYTGDGIMALFGAPIAHEDSVSRAVHAALGIQARMGALNHKLQAEHGIRLALRIGLNTGPVVVGRIGDDLRMDYTAVGDTTNLAARMQQAARPGTVVVIEAAHGATRGLFETVDLGELAVKGRAPARAYEVVRALGHRARLELAAERGLTPLVGRRRELDTLHDLFEQARVGRGQAVLVAGEAGIGKSRLLYEFRHALEGAGIEFDWVENRCISYGQSTAFGPLMEQLRRSFGIDDRDDAASIGAKIDRGVERMRLQPAQVPILRYLLAMDPGDQSVTAMDPPARRGRIFEAMRALTAAAASQRPQVLVFEDLHWVDGATEEYLKWLLDSLAGLRILLIGTHRLDYTPPLGVRSFLSTLPLRNLEAEEALEVAGRVLGSGELPDEIKRVVLEKAEGVPLFVEELTHTLLNLGVVNRDGAALRMAASLDALAVPDTIQGIIMARIDRLGDEGKRLVQHACVIGRQFVQRLLERMAPVERMAPLLRELQALEIIHEQTASAEPAYIFRHALIQDVVYNSLLRERRRELHREVGHAIEELYPDRIAERLEELAHHFVNAEAWDKAFEYLVRSGDRAKDAYASQAALNFYRRALEAAAHMSPPPAPARIIAVYQQRGVAWRISSGYAQAIAEFERMLELARSAGDTLAEGEALVELALAHYLTASSEHVPAATRCANAALAIAEQTGDQRILARSLCYLGLIDQVDGNLHEGDRKFGRSLEISERRGYQDMVSQNLAWLSLHANWRGDFGAAVPLCRRSREAATAIHDGFHEMMALSNLAFPLVGMGDYAGAGQVMDEAVRLARERDNKFIVARVLNTRGWMCQELGDFRGSSELNQEALQAARGNPNAEISTLINVAYDHLHGGDLSAALELLEQTFERVDKHAFGAHRWRWTIHLSQYIGETLLARGNATAALHMADRALARATQTGSLKYVGKARALRGSVALQQGAALEAARELSEAVAIAQRTDYAPLAWHAGHLLLRAQLATARVDAAADTAQRVNSAINRLAAAAPQSRQRQTFLERARVNAAMEDVARLLQ